jgi:thiol-disulfide isomerase/thioredoxin
MLTKNNTRCLLLFPSLMMVGAGCDRTQPEKKVPVSTLTAEKTVGAETPKETPDDIQPEVGNQDQITPPAEFPGNQISAPVLNDQTELRNRPFVTLEPKDTDDPAALLIHLEEIDRALQDLVLAGSSNLLDKSTFTEGGLRLGRMKRSAGQRLAESPTASEKQRKSGKIAQLVALSHMSGLGDVESAKELERYAAELVNSGDPDLSHQSRVVLLGFELQSLQNGQNADPNVLLEQIEGLFQRPEDLNFPEFMVLQQADQVLTQMGFAEAAKQVREILVTEYRTSADPQLRGEAWLIETRGSQAYQNFLIAFNNLGSEAFDNATAMAAVRGLYSEFPSIQTIEQIANTVSNIEYSGQVELSRDIVSFINTALEDHPDSDHADIEKILADHTARVSLLNKPFQLNGITGFDGSGFQLGDYAGKVVLVDFWASWCVPCLREIPTIRALYAQLNAEGFEVISVNMDENLATAREFVQVQAFPWRTYHSQDEDALGFRAPFAREMGISAIPFMVLVGRDGRVAAVHVRGQRLKPSVKALLGQKPDAAPATTP